MRQETRIQHAGHIARAEVVVGQGAVERNREAVAGNGLHGPFFPLIDGVDPATTAYAECRDMIDGAIRGRARELTKKLGYAIPVAEEILVSAIAQYIDDRFSVTNRRVLGLL